MTNCRRVVIDAFAAGVGKPIWGHFEPVVHGIRPETAINLIAVDARCVQGNWADCADWAGRGLGRSTRFRWVAAKQRKRVFANGSDMASQFAFRQ